MRSPAIGNSSTPFTSSAPSTLGGKAGGISPTLHRIITERTHRTPTHFITPGMMTRAPRPQASTSAPKSQEIMFHARNSSSGLRNPFPTAFSTLHLSENNSSCQWRNFSSYRTTIAVLAVVTTAQMSNLSSPSAWNNGSGLGSLLSISKIHSIRYPSSNLTSRETSSRPTPDYNRELQTQIPVSTSSLGHSSLNHTPAMVPSTVSTGTSLENTTSSVVNRMPPGLVSSTSIYLKINSFTIAGRNTSRPSSASSPMSTTLATMGSTSRNLPTRFITETVSAALLGAVAHATSDGGDLAAEGLALALVAVFPDGEPIPLVPPIPIVNDPQSESEDESPDESSEDTTSLRTTDSRYQDYQSSTTSSESNQPTQTSRIPSHDHGTASSTLSTTSCSACVVCQDLVGAAATTAMRRGFHKHWNATIESTAPAGGQLMEKRAENVLSRLNRADGLPACTVTPFTARLLD